MPNGRPGDHWFGDIVVHRIPTFSPAVDDLIRELDRLHGRSVRERMAAIVDAQLATTAASDLTAEQLAELESGLSRLRAEPR